MSKKQPKRPSPPSNRPRGDEPEESAPVWLERAVARHDARQEHLAHMFDGARASVQSKRQGVDSLFAGLPDEEEEAAPRIAALEDAHQAFEERQRQLGGMFGDAVKAREQERASLQKMFGDRPRKPGRR